MANRHVINVTGASTSNPLPLDLWLQSSVILGAKVSGSVTYTVQHTFDSPWVVGGLTNATWYNHGESALVSATANAEGNLMNAPTAVRLVNHAGSTGETTLTVIQTGGFPT